MQQIDGNIIAPKILGESTGISSLCVIVSLAVMGSLWGILGMVVGVPVFAVIVTLIKQQANAKLEKKNLSTDLNDYYVFESQEARKSRKKKLFPKLMHRLNTWARIALGACCFIGASARYLYFTKIKKRKLLAPKFADYRSLFLATPAVAVVGEEEEPMEDAESTELESEVQPATDNRPATPKEAKAAGAKNKRKRR